MSKLLKALIKSPYSFFNEYGLDRETSFYYGITNSIVISIVSYTFGYILGSQ